MKRKLIAAAAAAAVLTGCGKVTVIRGAEAPIEERSQSEVVTFSDRETAPEVTTGTTMYPSIREAMKNSVTLTVTARATTAPTNSEGSELDGFVDDDAQVVVREDVDDTDTKSDTSADGAKGAAEKADGTDNSGTSPTSDDADGGNAVTTAEAADSSQAAETTVQTTVQTTVTTVQPTETTTTAVTVSPEETAAQKQLLANEYDRTAAVFNAASAELNDARNTYNTIYARVNDLSAKADSARQTGASFSRDAYGFFEYVGADDALDVLYNAAYASDTDRNDAGDATQLDNIKAVFPLIRECNSIRIKNGLSRLNVSDKLMAMAMSDINRSAKTMDHSRQFTLFENLSWGYDDPFDIWYYQERTNNGGHYKNLMTADLVCTGFAYSTSAKNGKYVFSHSQTYMASWQDTGTMYTVDEYEARFNEFYNAGSINKASAYDSKLSAAKIELEAADKVLAEKQAVYDSASADYNAAKAAYEAF